MAPPRVRRAFAGMRLRASSRHRRPGLLMLNGSRRRFPGTDLVPFRSARGNPFKPVSPTPVSVPKPEHEAAHSPPSRRLEPSPCGRYRRHLHRHRGLRRANRQADIRQGAVDTGPSGRRHQCRGRKGRQRLPIRRAVPARLDHRHQHHSGAHRRQDRAAYHRGLPRHLRDRPHQPAGRLQSVSSASTSRWSSARCASRSRSGCCADGEIETPLDDAEIASFGRMLDGLGIEATAILFLQLLCPADHEARAKAILEKNHPNMFVSASHELSRGVSRVRALLDGGRQRLCRARSCAATSARSTTTSAAKASPARS